MKKILIALLLLASAPAPAVSPFIEGHVGALGLGAELGLDFGLFRIRAQSSGYDYDSAETFDGVDYDTTIELGGTGVILDFAPFNGNFFISAGLFENDVNLSANSDVITTTIGGAPYTGRVFADAKFDRQAPYFGLGWRFLHEPDKSGFGGTLDVGAYLNGDAEVNIETDGTPVPQSAIEQEEENIKKDITGEEVLPVIKLGLVYYF